MANDKRQRIPVLEGYGIFDDEDVMVEGPFDSEQEAAEALAELAGEMVAETGGEPIENIGLTVEPIRRRSRS